MLPKQSSYRSDMSISLRNTLVLRKHESERYNSPFANIFIPYLYSSQPIENIYRLLRPGGTAFLTFAASSPGLYAFEASQAMPKYQPYVKGVCRIIPHFQDDEKPSQRVITLLGDAGFQIHSCSYRAMSYLFDTKDYLKKYLTAIDPFEKNCMPSDLREEYMRDLMREFSKREMVLNKDSGVKDDCSTLSKYNVFVVYLEKPLDT